MAVLAVFIGGGIGSVCRYLLGSLVQSRAPGVFPIGTLLVNVLGCLAAGVLAKYFLQVETHQLMRVALVVGFCGGFTTFSTFSVEAVGLWTGGKAAMALTYVVASFALCLASGALGYALGRSFHS